MIGRLLKGFPPSQPFRACAESEGCHKGGDAILCLEADIAFLEIDLDVAGDHFENLAAICSINSGLRSLRSWASTSCSRCLAVVALAC